jgi:hypothetical protein
MLKATVKVCVERQGSINSGCSFEIDVRQVLFIRWPSRVSCTVLSDAINECTRIDWTHIALKVGDYDFFINEEN